MVTVSYPAVDSSGRLKHLNLDPSGNLLTAGAGSGGTSSVDGSAFTAGVSAGTPLIGVVNPADTPADGTEAVVALDGSRRLKIAGTITTSATTSNTSSAASQQTIGTTAAQAIAANANRKRLILQNCGTTVIKVILGAASPTQANYHFSLAPCGTANDGSSVAMRDDMWTGAVQVISSAAGGLLQAEELT